MAVALSIRGLRKSFGPRVALDGVDLEIATGEFYTLFGPNGAGKTTLVRCLATLARPSAGRVLLDGVDVTAASPAARSRVGVVSHKSYLYGELSARANLEFFASMYELADPARSAREAARRVGLSDRLDDPVATFSRGLEQRCAIARALLHQPAFLLFDEPFSGLDPLAADRLETVLRDEHAAGRTILMTSHDLARGSDLAGRAGVLHRGRLHACDTVEADAVAVRYREVVTS